MEDYHCQQITLASSQSIPQEASSSQTGTSHPISTSLVYTRLSPNQRAFAPLIPSHFEPHTYDQAAMQAKISALEETSTWELTPLPVNKHLIGCK